MSQRLNGLIILSILVMFAIANGQIKRHYEYDPSKIYQSRYGVRFFTGSFDFESFPGPLQTTRVSFTLEVVKTDLPQYSKDWTIGLHYLDNVVKVLSDTVFYWPGPHKIGDTFIGYIDFIPLLSSKWGMTLYWKPPDGGNTFLLIQKGVPFYWCINEDGILEDLGVPGDHDSECSLARVYFFKKDSIHISQFPDSPASNLFNCDIVVKPLPKIGDTSFIYYNLTALWDIRFRREIKVEGSNIAFTEIPERIDLPILKGQHIEIKIGFVPMKALNRQKVHMSCAGQSIPCSFIFNNDSTLRYVGTGGFGYISDDKLPQNFPSVYKRIVENISIVEDSVIVEE